MTSGHGAILLTIFLCVCQADWQVAAQSQPVHSFIHLFVHLFQNLSNDILKTDESISVPVGISSPWGKGIKQSTLGQEVIGPLFRCQKLECIC